MTGAARGTPTISLSAASMVCKPPASKTGSAFSRRPRLSQRSRVMLRFTGTLQAYVAASSTSVGRAAIEINPIGLPSRLNGERNAIYVANAGRFTLVISYFHLRGAWMAELLEAYDPTVHAGRVLPATQATLLTLTTVL